MYCANCEKFLPKYRIMWPMPSYLFWNLAILFSNSSLGSEKLKQNRHSLIKSRLTDLFFFSVLASQIKLNRFIYVWSKQAETSLVLCRVYTNTRRPKTLYRPIPNEQLVSGYICSTDTCRRIQVARSGYMLTISRWHNYTIHLCHGRLITLYPATDGRQLTGDKIMRVYGDKWIELVPGNMSWCKRGFTHAWTEIRERKD